MSHAGRRQQRDYRQWFVGSHVFSFAKRTATAAFHATNTAAMKWLLQQADPWICRARLCRAAMQYVPSTRCILRNARALRPFIEWVDSNLTSSAVLVRPIEE
jgi:hypothetical protein